MSESDIKIVNVVGTGALNVELDVNALAEDIGPECWTNDGPHPGLHTRMDGSGQDGKTPLVTFYRSGKFILRAESIDRLHEEKEVVIARLKELGIVDDRSEIDFHINNIVANAELGVDVFIEGLVESMELFPDDIELEMSKAEYESDMFPAFIYRDDAYPCTFLVYANGKVVMPGGTDITEIEDAYADFSAKLLDALGM